MKRDNVFSDFNTLQAGAVRVPNLIGTQNPSTIPYGMYIRLPCWRKKIMESDRKSKDGIKILSIEGLVMKFS